ncbi:MAG: FAD:protein FMN transferase [Ignavibacteriae bacterium]|nr:FAD:protein FMN transferase [Ignavibacteriota bacterium]
MMSAPAMHRHSHHAMATLFEVFIAGEDPGFAAGAAQAAFEEIDRLEQEFSRYRPNSDIARINNLSPGGETRVSADTFACLQLAHQYWKATNGAFDITMGALMDVWVAPDRSLKNPDVREVEEAVRRSGMHLLTLDEETYLVGVGDHVPRIDPGAIGKGYAVDACIELLHEWGVDAALVHGGTSTAKGYGHAWPVTASSFADPSRVLREFTLDAMALSGSGMKKGRHIIDTRTHQPVAGRHAAWVCVPSATESDALSTAFMVMSMAEIAEFCAARSDLRAIVIDDDGASGERVLSYGWGSGGSAGG